jgi:hypothetical protein
MIGEPVPDTERLAPELVALVHHIELDKAGWWERALQSLALTALQLRAQEPPLSAADICETLRDQFQIEIPDCSFDEALRALVDQGDAIEAGDARFRISDPTLLRCQAEVAGAVDLEDRVREQFQKQLSLICPSLDGTRAWNAFVQEFLIPTVKDLGAGAYEILTDRRLPVGLSRIDDFTRQFSAEFSVDLTNFLRGFLDPSNPSVRRFVLRTLNALFVVHAGGLDKKTIERLSESARAFSATLFFDSNVLFSLLGLHENPADSSSRALLDLVHKLSTSVPVKLRVLPPTLDEMKRVMRASQEALLELRISPTLLQSAIAVGISGITAKYLALAAGRKQNVAPTDYFEPYLKNLLTILHGHGVELFNEDLSKYGVEQDVIDDILERQTFEAQRYSNRAKSYEQLRHDMVLWHFVKDKRPLRPESPIDAEYWIVTADFRLLGFDAYKHRKITSDVPICMHPIALIQLLRFWVPMDEELETALFNAIRLPTVVAPIDTDAERISLQILNALSTFENIGDLPQETVTRILLNDALRQRLAAEKDISKQIELVRDALIDENRLSEAKLQAERTRSAALQTQTKMLEGEVTNQSQQIDALQTQLQREISRAQEQTVLALEIKSQVDKLILAKSEQVQRAKFCEIAALSACAIPAAWYMLAHFGASHTFLGTICGGAALVWYLVFRFVGARLQHVAKWPTFEKFSKHSGTVIFTLLAGIGTNAAWELLKKWFSN